jgi:hypothetical protein
LYADKENERRVVNTTPLQKGQPITRRFTAGPTASDCPALLAMNGRHRKVVSLRRVAVPFFAALLGCVKRQEYFTFNLYSHSVTLCITSVEELRR